MTVLEMQGAIATIKALYKVNPEEAHRELNHLLWRFIGVVQSGYSNVQDLAIELGGIDGEFPFVAK